MKNRKWTFFNSLLLFVLTALSIGIFTNCSLIPKMGCDIIRKKKRNMKEEHMTLGTMYIFVGDIKRSIEFYKLLLQEELLRSMI